MIHEGTNGIQSIDLLGRKMRMNQRRGLAVLCREMRRTIAEARSCGDAELDGRAGALDEAVARLQITTHKLLDAGMRICM